MNFSSEENKIRERILFEYDNNLSTYTDFLVQMNNLVERLILDNNISSISSRIKSKNSLKNKIDNKQKKMNKSSYKYNRLNDITDVCGLRICTIYSDDVDKISNIIENEFFVDRENSIDKRSTLEPDKFGYLSVHYIVSLSKNRAKLTEYERFKDFKFEIQIRSILQNTWAEIEHDLGYKSEKGIPQSIKRDFSRLAGLLEIADKEFINIRNSLNEYTNKVTKKIQSATDIESIDINRISLTEFIKSNYFKEIIIDTEGRLDNIEINLESWLSSTSLSTDLDDLVACFKLLDISTIGEIKKLFSHSNNLLILSSNDDYEFPALLPIAIFYYVFYYIILSRDMGVDTLSEIFNILGIGVDPDYEYQDLMRLLND
ncbi:GTP pyrophosphokinase family protein [Enterococcus casseliflavus]|uniref:GTP pyrophosphokinase n=1 Tax=Enterococcus casseliflavus TaxID=37734 RepID=UPI0039A6ECC4